MSKLKRSVSLLALGALFGIGGLTAIALTPSRPASASPSTAPGIGIWALGGHLAGVATPGLYSTAIASTSDAATLAGLPGRSLAYFAGTDVNVNWSTGVPYSQALANGWLLTGSTGSLLTNTGYPSNYVALNASGYIPGDTNSNDGTNTVAWWKQLGPYANGLMNEYYDETSNGTYQLRTTGTAWYQQWGGWQRLIGTAQSMGDDFFGLMKGTAGNTAAMQYGKASFLLEWNGGGGAFMYGATDGSDPTNSSWTTSIGQPAAAKQQLGVGWMRLYSAGVALVNPSPTSPQTFSLGGSYTTPSGATVTSVTLQPGTGMVLTGAASTATTTTTTATSTNATTTTTTTATTTTASTTTTATTTTTNHGHHRPKK